MRMYIYTTQMHIVKQKFVFFMESIEPKDFDSGLVD